MSQPLKPMEYQNTYALAVSQTFAKKHQLAKISDLAKIQSQLQAGFSLEFNDRPDGYLGLEKVYGLNFKVQHHGAITALSGHPDRSRQSD